MLPNGLVHLANDTFLAVSPDEVDNVFLVTSSVREEQITPFPLARRVRFEPTGEPGSLRHSLYASGDGKYVAAISTGQWQHFIIDVLSARVCEFITREPVVGVTWHPSSEVPILLLLCADDTVAVRRPDRTVLGVTFRNLAEYDCRSLTDALEDKIDGSDASLVAPLNDTRGRQHAPRPLPIADAPSTSAPLPISATGTSSSAALCPTASRGGERGSFVALASIAATRSLPPLLLLLKRGGDVFSVKLGDDGAPAAHIPDGALRGSGETGVAVHLLLRGEAAAVAVGAFCADADAGRHAVFVLHADGALRGVWVDEPDLLSPQRMRRRCDFRLAFAFAGGGASLRTSGNVTLVRCGADAAFLCVWPQRAQHDGPWTYRRATHKGAACLPTPPSPRVPLAWRLPYATGGGVAVGEDDVAALPLRTVVVAKLANLLRAALYAGGERYGLIGTAPNAALEALLEATGECCRKWICGFPHAEIDATTAELAGDVERRYEELSARKMRTTVRERQLALRVAAVQQRMRQLAGHVRRSQTTVRDAVAHRRGVTALYVANDQLGEIHSLLRKLERIVEKRNTENIRDS